MATSDQCPFLYQVEGIDLNPAKIKMDLLSAFDHIVIYAQKKSWYLSICFAVR